MTVRLPVPPAVLLAVMTSLAGSSLDSDRERGLRAAREGNCKAALADLTPVVARNPQLADAQEAVAVCETRLGHPDRATAAFQQVVKLRPGDWQAWNNLGANLVAIGHSARGAAAFRKAVALNPRSESAWFNLGSTLLNLGDNGGAFRALDRSRSLAPADPEIKAAWEEGARRSFGDAEELVSKQQFAKAKTLLLSVRGAMENSAAWNNLLGYVEFKLNEPKTALDHLQKALALEPHNEGFLLDIGEFLIHYRANSAAREFFEIGARAMPGSVRVQFLLAVSYILEDRRSAAVPLLEKTIGLDPDFEPAYKALGECYEDARDGESLIRLGERLAARRPASPTGPYLRGLGLMQIATENHTSLNPAIAAFQSALRRDPQLVEAHFNLGKAYQWEDNVSAAMAEMEQTVRLDPQHERAHYSLAQLYRKTGNSELASRELKIHGGLKARPRPLVLLVEARDRAGRQP